MDENEDPPFLDIRQSGNNGPTASLDAITTLIHSFASMITAMEGRITTQIKDNAAASKERWARWESDFREYRDATDKRLTMLEKSVHDHQAVYERDKLIVEARVRPVKNATVYLMDHWKTIALIIALVIGWILAGVESIEHLGL